MSRLDNQSNDNLKQQVYRGTTYFHFAIEKNLQILFSSVLTLFLEVLSRRKEKQFSVDDQLSSYTDENFNNRKDRLWA